MPLLHPTWRRRQRDQDYYLLRRHPLPPFAANANLGLPNPEADGPSFKGSFCWLLLPGLWGPVCCATRRGEAPPQQGPAKLQDLQQGKPLCWLDCRALLDCLTASIGALQHGEIAGSGQVLGQGHHGR
jgi:hypothetical protein